MTLRERLRRRWWALRAKAVVGFAAGRELLARGDEEAAGRAAEQAATELRRKRELDEQARMAREAEEEAELRQAANAEHIRETIQREGWWRSPNDRGAEWERWR